MVIFSITEGGRILLQVQKKVRWSAAQRWKRSTDLMFMLGLNESMEQLDMANSVHWYGYVLRKTDGHVLRRAFDFEVEGEKKMGRRKRTWRKQVVEESVEVGL